jgi:putative spermidine/putrescine transport system substrate-binding protein
LKTLDATTLANLPNSPANSKNSLRQDMRFWADHGEDLEQRFAAWASQ